MTVSLCRIQVPCEALSLTPHEYRAMTTEPTIEPVLQAAAQVAPALTAPNPATLLAAAPAVLTLMRKVFPTAVAVIRRHPIQTAAVAIGLLLLARSNERRSNRQRIG